MSEQFSLTLIKDVHGHYCHIGINQTKKWDTAKNITKNIKNFCKNCEICINNKSRGQKKFGLMSHLGPATKPFEIVFINTISTKNTSICLPTILQGTLIF